MKVKLTAVAWKNQFKFERVKASAQADNLAWKPIFTTSKG